ncbi:MAG: SMC-Scp complex subunit ScpB [Pontiellaceae bacterium]|nr:SMC-Scp complex subunit ScpB [Pontiellaceae bacterium]
MSESTIDVLPELKQIVGAMLFAAKEPLSIKRIRKAMIETGSGFGGPYEQYAKVTESQIEGALELFQEDLLKAKVGLDVALVGGAYRLQNDAVCGPFVRALLEKNQTVRLSKPALETLAIVAYRQPCLRSEIEEVRGVSVDAILRKLMDMQLVRVVRRSELPGRPWLFGTTQRFLEHFGINSIDDLPGSQELKRGITGDEKKVATPTFPEMEKELEIQ